MYIIILSVLNVCPLLVVWSALMLQMDHEGEKVMMALCG